MINILCHYPLCIHYFINCILNKMLRVYIYILFFFNVLLDLDIFQNTQMDVEISICDRGARA